MFVQNAMMTIRAPDGLHLSGTFVLPEDVCQGVVLVHGGGVTREEGGFFTRLAAGLADAGIASLRCDLRGHGSSEGRQEDLTIAGILGDLRAAIAFVRARLGADRVACSVPASAVVSAVTTPPSTRLSWPA
jgi:alpha-beta hydrolase superfamily lysophospholipase